MRTQPSALTGACCARVENPQPVGIVCSTGTHLATWALAPGRWRISSLSTDVQRCGNGVTNDGGSRCVGGTVDAQRSSDDLCLEGHAGPLCKLCLANESRHAAYFDEFHGRCKGCPTDVWARAGAVLGGMVGVVVLVYGIWHCSRAVPTSVHPSTQPVAGRRCSRLYFRFPDGLAKVKVCIPVRRATVFLRGVVAHVLSRATVPRLKIAVAFYQVVSVLPKMYGIEMPSAYREPPPLCIMNPAASCC
jgi:hypothetical protein